MCKLDPRSGSCMMTSNWSLAIGDLSFPCRDRSPRCCSLSDVQIDLCTLRGLLVGGDRQSLCCSRGSERERVAVARPRIYTTDRPSHPAVTSCCLVCLDSFSTPTSSLNHDSLPKKVPTSLFCDTICCPLQANFLSQPTTHRNHRTSCLKK